MIRGIKMELVSVIIPVYGVEAYLKECLESVLKQTYSNLEIILIDDESPDQCPKICDDYAKEDSRIKVIHQKNGGAANARNHGLDKATGKYICFVDSDDKIEPDYVEKLIVKVKEENADIVVCSFKEWYPDKMDCCKEFQNKEYSGRDFIRRFLVDWTCGLIWNKIFRKETLNGVRFEEGHKIDDEFFTYQAVLKAKKVVMMDECLYWYRMRKSGVMRSGEKYKEQMIKDRLEYIVTRYEKVIKQYPDVQKEYLQNLSDNLIRLERQARGNQELEKRIRKEKRKYIGQIIFKLDSFKMKYSFIRSFFDDAKEEQKIDNNEERYFE